jgi:hypothetical protein
LKYYMGIREIFKYTVAGSAISAIVIPTIMNISPRSEDYTEAPFVFRGKSDLEIDAGKVEVRLAGYLEDLARKVVDSEPGNFRDDDSYRVYILGDKIYIASIGGELSFPANNDSILIKLPDKSSRGNIEIEGVEKGPKIIIRYNPVKEQEWERRYMMDIPLLSWDGRTIVDANWHVEKADVKTVEDYFEKARQVEESLSNEYSKPKNKESNILKAYTRK